MRFEGFVVSLLRGKPPAINNVTLSGDRYSSSELHIAEAGMFVVVSVTHYGLNLLWDKGKY